MRQMYNLVLVCPIFVQHVNNLIQQLMEVHLLQMLKGKAEERGSHLQDR